jgi:DNA invertase Pin-like site-specific DNA recombinase
VPEGEGRGHLDAYIRVSQVAGRNGDRFISPAVQREEIEVWISAHGATLGKIFEELDESGARGDRPLLQEAIERVEAGESGGIVVAKLDRFGRSVIEGLEAIQRIERAGGTFASVQDGFDLGTPTGRLALRFLFSIGEWELGRVRRNWNDARGRAISRGVYIAKDPLGYRKGPDGRLRIDPEEAPVVREVFERRAAGELGREIAARLNAGGTTTRLGRPFRASTVSRIVQNPAYRGEARHGAHRNPCAHEPIVDPALWQLCQETPWRSRREGRSLLGGLARCGSCGRLMSICPRPPRGPRRSYSYSCDMPKRICSAPAYARAEDLDYLVEAFIFRRTAASSADAGEEVRACEDEVEAAEADLLAYRDEPSIRSALGAASFAAGLAARRRRVERSLANLGRARYGRGGTSDSGTDLAAEWSQLDSGERRAALAERIECVLIAPGSSPVVERARVFPPGASPVFLVNRRLVFASNPPAPGGERLKALRRWPASRLESELRGFVAGREVWPYYCEFAEAGKSQLFAQALAYGGPCYWGHRLGVRVPPFCVQWDRRRVRAALVPLLRGRSRWPGEKGFREAGMLPVYHAARTHGGIAYWAAQFGCSPRKARTSKWSEERIARELAEFTAGRDRFPTKSEFESAGQRPLYEAICRNGGVAGWTERFRVAETADAA